MVLIMPVLLFHLLKAFTMKATADSKLIMPYLQRPQAFWQKAEGSDMNTIPSS